MWNCEQDWDKQVWAGEQDWDKQVWAVEQDWDKQVRSEQHEDFEEDQDSPSYLLGTISLGNSKLINPQATTYVYNGHNVSSS